MNSGDHYVSTDGPHLVLNIDGSNKAFLADMDDDGIIGDVSIEGDYAAYDVDLSGLTPKGNFSAGIYTESTSSSEGGGVLQKVEESFRRWRWRWIYCSYVFDNTKCWG